MEKTGVAVSIRAVFFSSLISIAVWMTLAALGVAIGETMGEQTAAPSHALSLVIAIFGIAILTLTFFAGGYLSSSAARVQHSFAAVLQSLATWACLSIVLIALMFSAMAADDTVHNLQALKSMRILTKIEILKGEAVTTFNEGAPKIDTKSKPIDTKSKPEEEPQKAEKGSNMLLIAWWIIFMSVLLGGGAAIGGGLVAKKGVLKNSLL